jgi:hypothetical protein
MRMKIPFKNDGWQINWCYESTEWKRFEKWELFRKGGIHLLKFLIMLLLPGKPKEVKISQYTVLIGRKSHPFHSDRREFQTADIYDAGAMHILEICYKEKEIYGVIRIPVPKGKLKDAIMLEKSLFRNDT